MVFGPLAGCAACVKIGNGLWPSDDLKSDIVLRRASGRYGQTIQIHQVLMNLCSYAAYAMNQNGGCLELVLTDMTLTEKSARRMVDFRPGEYVIVSISDTGIGMDREITDRIFDPGFTTREAGEGTEQGLDTAPSIVKDHSGVIRVKSRPGAGSVFDTYYPATAQRQEKKRTGGRSGRGNRIHTFRR